VPRAADFASPGRYELGSARSRSAASYWWRTE
jgi:hypothetical protein